MHENHCHFCSAATTKTTTFTVALPNGRQMAFRADSYSLGDNGSLELLSGTNTVAFFKAGVWAAIYDSAAMVS